MLTGKRKRLYLLIRDRITNGESKQALFAELSQSHDKTDVGKFISYVPTNKSREKYKVLRGCLLLMLIVITLLDVGNKIAYLKVSLIVLIPVLVDIYIIYEIVTYPRLGYILVIVCFLSSILPTIHKLDFCSKATSNLAYQICVDFGACYLTCIIGSIILSMILIKKMFPNTTIVKPKPRVDKNGVLQFED